MIHRSQIKIFLTAMLLFSITIVHGQMLSQKNLSEYSFKNFQTAIGLVNTHLSPSDKGTYFLFYDVEYLESNAPEFKGLNSKSSAANLKAYFNEYGMDASVKDFKSMAYPSKFKNKNGKTIEFYKNQVNHQIRFLNQSEENEFLILEQVSVGTNLHFLFVAGKIN